MADKRWKRVEREKCRELGGERTGPTGRDLPDCKGLTGLGLEVKAYKRLVFLTADWNQAVENASKLGVIPVLAVKESGRGGRDVVQLFVRDFIHLCGWASRRCDIEEAYRPPTPAGVMRLDWKDFVRLYRAAIDNNTQEETA